MVDSSRFCTVPKLARRLETVEIALSRVSIALVAPAAVELFVRDSKLLFAILDTAFCDTDLCVPRREVLVASGEGASRRLDRCLGFFELGFYAA